MGDYRNIVLANDDTNETLCVAGREAHIWVSGYGRSVESGVLAARSLAPGYGRFGKSRAKRWVTVPGYATTPITVQIVRFPNS